MFFLVNSRHVAKHAINTKLSLPNPELCLCIPIWNCFGHIFLCGINKNNALPLGMAMCSAWFCVKFGFLTRASQAGYRLQSQVVKDCVICTEKHNSIKNGHG